VTLCSDADENCPFFPAKTRVVHRGFDDPPLLARGETDPEKKLAHYRRVRDEIRDFVTTLPEALDTI
jgi:arsenate reductase